MKVVKLFFALLIMIGATQVQAQTKIKFGHVDMEMITSSLPAWDSVVTQVTALEKSYKDGFEALNKYAEQKQNEYVTKSKDPSVHAVELSQIKDDLGGVLQNIERYWTDINPEYQQKAQELQQPIIEKIQNAIKEYAIANSYTYISDKGNFYYAADSQDVTSGVLAKLGVQTTKKEFK